MNTIMISKCRLCGCKVTQVHEILALYVFECGSQRRFGDPNHVFWKACKELKPGQYMQHTKPWEHGLIELPQLVTC